MSIRVWIGTHVRRVIRDYRLNWIYVSPPSGVPCKPPSGLVVRRATSVDVAHLAASPDLQARKAVGYAKTGATSFALVNDGDALLGIAHFVERDRYAHASTWPLAEDQLALVDIVVLPAARGQGNAARLIEAATPMALASAARGEAICFIWWNHHASLRAFRRAGWRQIAFSVELVMRSGRIRRIAIPWPGRAR